MNWILKSEDTRGIEGVALFLEGIAYSKVWRCERETYLRQRNPCVISPGYNMCVLILCNTDLLTHRTEE